MKMLPSILKGFDLNQKNYDICAQREAFYTKELTEIRNAKSAANFDTLVAELKSCIGLVSAIRRALCRQARNVVGDPRNAMRSSVRSRDSNE